MEAAAAQLTAPSRGASLLLAHCALLEVAEPRDPAGDRLRDLVGPELASLLVSALAQSRGARYRNVA